MSGRRPSYTALLKQRSFAALWIAQVISQSGDAVFDVALLWLVLVTTGSTALVGVTQAAILIPNVVCSPIAGVFADRVNRRNQMIASNLAQGCVTAAIALLYALNTLNFSILVVLVLLLYTGDQFFRAANGAIIPRIARREDLPAANSLFMLSSSTNQLVTYTAGGIIVAAVGATAPITYDSLTFFLAAALLMLVAKQYGHPSAEPTAAGAPDRRRSFRGDFAEGLAYVRKTSIFRQILAVGLLVNFFGAAVSTLLAPYARDWVHGDASVYGISLASFALGSILGSLVLGKVNYREYVGKLLFGGIFAFGVLISLAGLVTVVPVALVIFCLLGLVQAVVNQPLQVLVQTEVPGGLLGRVVTVLGAVLTASQPIAAVLSGWLAGISSIGIVYVGSGVAMMALSLILYIPFAELRRARY